MPVFKTFKKSTDAITGKSPNKQKEKSKSKIRIFLVKKSDNSRMQRSLIKSTEHDVGCHPTLGMLPYWD